MILPGFLLVSFFVNYCRAKEATLVGNVMELIKSSLEERALRANVHSDAGLDIEQFTQKYNYPLEAHYVTTEDGFVLAVHRLPHGRDHDEDNVTESTPKPEDNVTESTPKPEDNVTESTPKPAVLLMHGLTCSAMDWLYLGPDESLGLILADLGYDVWLVNARGTRYSMNHTTLTPDDSAFWDYSFHEKGYYDLAASIDYVLNRTGLEKVTLIGHSQGTSDSMVLTSTREEYNDKLNLIVMLSPIGYMDGLSSPPIIFLVKNMEILQILFKLINLNGLPYSPIIGTIGKALCNDDSPVQELCAAILQMLCGYDFPLVNKTMLPVVLSNTPAGISVKELIHYGQEIKSGRFRQYDHGIKNIDQYGTINPPSYDLRKITAPVAAYYSQNDFLASVSNVEKLLTIIPNVTEKHLIDYKLFNHLDFIMGKKVKQVLYEKNVIPTIQQYNPLST